MHVILDGQHSCLVVVVQSSFTVLFAAANLTGGPQRERSV